MWFKRFLNKEPVDVDVRLLVEMRAMIARL
jgi:hypothetical protein